MYELNRLKEFKSPPEKLMYTFFTQHAKKILRLIKENPNTNKKVRAILKNQEEKNEVICQETAKGMYSLLVFHG